MAGISDKALKSQYRENKYKGNGGVELQNKEFSDGTGLEAYDATFRMYDPQIGRFWQIDPLGELAEGWSPYAFVLDNPISFSDPLGLDTATRKTNLDPVTVTPMHVHTPNNKAPDLAFIGTPPGGVDVPSAPMTPPEISVNPDPETPPVEEPPVGFTPLGGVLTVVGVLIPAGGPSFPNGDEMFYHKHPELMPDARRPITRNKPIEDIYLVRYGPEPESKEKLANDAMNAQNNGFPHGVSTFLRPNAPPTARSAKILEVMKHFLVLKTGERGDHYTVVLPNPVTQQAAAEFNLLFTKP